MPVHVESVKTIPACMYHTISYHTLPYYFTLHTCAICVCVPIQESVCVCNSSFLMLATFYRVLEARESRRQPRSRERINEPTELGPRKHADVDA